MTVVGVGMDGDGHFFVVNISDREKTIEHLQRIQDGDYYEDMIEEYGKPEPYWLFKGWLEWLRNFEQRGTFEFIEIET